MTPRDLIQKLIDSIDKTLLVASASDNGDSTFSFVFAEVKWLRVFKVFTAQNGATFRVVEIVFDSATGYTVKAKLLTGSFDAATVSVLIPAPFYWHGSVRMINGEVSKIKRSIDKTPMFYLRSLDEIDYNNDKTSRFLYSVPIELFVLDEANYKDWISDDYESEIIKPLETLVDAFVHQLKKQDQIFDAQPYQKRPIIKFAKEDDNGNVSKYFTDDLSGWRFRTLLQVINPLNCCKTKKFKFKN